MALAETTTTDRPGLLLAELPPTDTTRRLELVHAVLEVALASSDDLELAIATLDPYDRWRLVGAFAVCAERLDG